MSPPDIASASISAFCIASARERRWFWATAPSKPVVAAVIGEVFVGTVLTRVGLPGLSPLPWPQTLAVFASAMVSCLVLNDPVKVAMIRWRVSETAGRTPSEVTARIARRAYELYEQRGRSEGGAARDWDQAEQGIRSKDGQ